jgi:tol-pal system protein YbgF
METGTRLRRTVALAAALLSAGFASACVSTAEFRKLEYEVNRLKGGTRAGDLGACIDRFRGFLQTYPASDHADDAAYWMADCHYREGDYKAAVLRFADVVQRYPAADKAPDALYRQGEALLRLGPKYGSAAETAFERLINEYPDSPRVAEARRQLELLGPAEGGGSGNEG